MSRAALFVRWLLGVIAVVFVALGLVYMFFPTFMLRTMDIEAAPGKALADIRAIYGGLDLAFGILLSIYFFRKQYAQGLAVSVLLCTCIFCGRLFEIVTNPAARELLTFGLLSSEALGAVLSAVGWFLARQPEKAAVTSVSPATPIASATPAAQITATTPTAASPAEPTTTTTLEG